MADTLSIDQLRSFIAIAETGNYSKAAERVFRSQPALSMQIKRLEEQIGAQLLDRNHKETTVTEAGEVLLSYARRILDLNEEAMSRLSVVETEGSVRIGVLEEVALGPLVGLLTKFGRLCTRINLELHVLTSWELTDMINDDRICLAVANGMYSSDPVIPLWSERYVWVMNPDYPLLDENPLPLIMDPPNSPCQLRDHALGGLNKLGRRWNLVFSTVSVSAMKAAINAGLGVGMLFESEVGPGMRVLTVEDGLPEVPAAHIGLLRSRRATSEAVDCLADFLVRHLVKDDAKG
jgi:DNA-binding transcriptional LysR family regulator